VRPDCAGVTGERSGHRSSGAGSPGAPRQRLGAWLTSLRSSGLAPRSTRPGIQAGPARERRVRPSCGQAVVTSVRVAEGARRGQGRADRSEAGVGRAGRSEVGGKERGGGYGGGDGGWVLAWALTADLAEASAPASHSVSMTAAGAPRLHERTMTGSSICGRPRVGARGAWGACAGGRSGGIGAATGGRPCSCLWTRASPAAPCGKALLVCVMPAAFVVAGTPTGLTGLAASTSAPDAASARTAFHCPDSAAMSMGRRSRGCGQAGRQKGAAAGAGVARGGVRQRQARGR